MSSRRSPPPGRKLQMRFCKGWERQGRANISGLERENLPTKRYSGSLSLCEWVPVSLGRMCSSFENGPYKLKATVFCSPRSNQPLLKSNFGRSPIISQAEEQTGGLHHTRATTCNLSCPNYMQARCVTVCTYALDRLVSPLSLARFSVNDAKRSFFMWVKKGAAA